MFHVASSCAGLALESPNRTGLSFPYGTLVHPMTFFMVVTLLDVLLQPTNAGALFQHAFGDHCRQLLMRTGQFNFGALQRDACPSGSTIQNS